LVVGEHDAAVVAQQRARIGWHLGTRAKITTGISFREQTQRDEVAPLEKSGTQFNNFRFRTS
jgi:hypothetical protein